MEKIRNIAFISSFENLFMWLDYRVLENKLDKIVVFDKAMNFQHQKQIAHISGQLGITIDFEKVENKNSLFWNAEALSKVRSVVARYFNGDEAFVLTHSPDGEDGDNNSIVLSKIVTQLSSKELYYISIDLRSKHECKQSRKELLESLGHNSNDMFISHVYYRRLKIVSILLKRMFPKRIVDEKKYNCLRLRRHVVYLKYDLFKSYRDELFSMSKLNYILNPKEYFKKFNQLLKIYKDRNFLATEYYPKCKGKILNVGVHEFNRWDYVLFENAQEYHTIDIDNSYEVFGSPYFHKTIDFLEFEPEWTYDRIILFGVLGLPSRTGKDNYTLNGKYSEVFAKADSLLNVGGEILLGPDVYHDADNSNEIIWDKFFKSLAIVESKYEFLLKRVFDNNIVYIYKKLA